MGEGKGNSEAKAFGNLGEVEDRIDEVMARDLWDLIDGDDLRAAAREERRLREAAEAEMEELREVLTQAAALSKRHDEAQWQCESVAGAGAAMELRELLDRAHAAIQEPQRLRRPRQWRFGWAWVLDQNNAYLGESYFSLRDAKSLHEWLGRAIAWMEEQREKEPQR